MTGRIRMNLLAGTAILLATVSQGAYAQSTDEDTLRQKTITVTATKQNKSLDDTAGSLSVVSSDEIGAGGIQNAADLSMTVPNVSVGDQFGVNRTFIRGIGLTSIDLGADGAVAFLQNGAMISRPAAQLAGFYDLEQVEVLRGPQGTLYGRGATAGVINMVTKRPTREVEGYGRLTIGNYSMLTAEGAVGGPITDTISARVSAKMEERDGYGENLVTGNPVDDRNAFAVRGSVLFEPSSDFDVLLVADYFREDDYNYAFHYFGPTVVPDALLPGPALGGETIFDYYEARGQEVDLRNLYSDEDAINDREGTSIQAIANWDITPDLSLVSTTAYREFERFNRDDLDVSDIWAFGRNDYTEDSTSFSQEFTLNYQADNYSLLAGAMYFDEELFGEVRVPTVNLASYFNILLGTNLPANLFDNGNYLQNGVVDTTAYGAFLQGTYNITPQLAVTAGARYNYEERKGVGRFTFEAQGQNIPTDKSADWDSVTPKLLIEYTTDGGSLLYGSITKGFKSGVINVGSVNSVIDPENVWSYEAGFRTRIVDDRLSLNGAAFYYDYTDLQVGFVNANNIVETINAASAVNWGLEAEMVFEATDNLTFRAFGTYLNAEFDEFCNGYYAAGDPNRVQYPTCPSNPALSDLSGNQLPSAPEYSFAVFADYRVDLSNGATVDIGADANYQDDIYFTEFNNKDAFQEAFTMLNARVRWTSPNGGWFVEGWGKNLADEEVFSNNINASPLYGYVRVGSLRPPQTYGVTLGIDF